MINKIKKLLKAIKIKNFEAVIKYIKNNGFKGLYSTCINYIRFGKVVLDEYATWIANNEPNAEMFEKQKKYVSCQDLTFEFISTEYNRSLSESIQEQTYQKFDIKQINSNQMYLKTIQMSDKDYIIFTKGDISLTPFAVYEIAKSIEYRDSIMIYADNDKLVDGKRKEPHFKPDFARDTILSQNYIGNLLVVKTDFLKIHDDILEDLGEQVIYDIALRISEKTRKIEHITKILYHELQDKMDINVSDEKEIIKKHLNRMHLEYENIEDGKFIGQYHINYKIHGNPKVSIVIPNKDHVDDLKKCIDSILESTYCNYEIVIVENNSEDKETFGYYKKLSEKHNIKIVTLKISEFNYSAIVNFGVENSSGEYIILLNNDIEIISKNWIEQMLMYCQRPDVGICGAKLYFQDRSIQHAGVTIGTRGLAGHRFREMQENEYHDRDYINIVQNLSAVTAACFMVRKQLYIDLLGFDEKLAVAFNDVDFCLKVRTAKYLIVYNPFVEAYHYESKSRGQDISGEKQKRFSKEYELFVKRWSKVIGKGDPYYNKNYRLDTDLPKINYNKIV